jgi:hypothetical protein
MEQQITENDIKAKEDNARAAIDLANKVRKLMKNREYRAVFEDHYFKRYAADLVKMKSMPVFEAKEAQERLDREIIAIGEVQQFLDALVGMGRMAEKELNDLSDLRTDLAEEEALEGAAV